MNSPQHEQQEQSSRRSVSFNDEVRCLKGLHLNNYTDEEVFDSWFTPKEYKEMKREMKLTVSMMDKKSKFTEGAVFSARGLEHRSRENLMESVQHRYYAVRTVLEEQDRQRRLNEESGQVCDPAGALQVVYAEYSFVSHMRAFLTAAADEKIAMQLNGDLKAKAQESSVITKPKSRDTSPNGTLKSPQQKSMPLQSRYVAPPRRVFSPASPTRVFAAP